MPCIVTFKDEYKSCFWKPVYSCNVIYDMSCYIRYGRQSFTMAHLENILLDNTPYWYWYIPILLLIAETVVHAHRSYRYKAVVFIYWGRGNFTYNRTFKGRSLTYTAKLCHHVLSDAFMTNRIFVSVEENGTTIYKTLLFTKCNDVSIYQVQ